MIWVFAAKAVTGAAIPLATSAAVPSHLRVALSGISSSISLACWIVLLLPQLIEQWRLGSSEGISPLFIGIWFFGDICNLIGAIWADLLPGVILLALWFCFADALMFASYFYYRPKPSSYRKDSQSQRRHSSLEEGYGNGSAVSNMTGNTQPESSASTNTNSVFQNGQSSQALDDPSRPLLERRSSDSNYTSNRRSSRRKSSKRVRRDSLVSIINQPTQSTSSIIQKYVLPLLFVIGAGVLGYFFSDSEAKTQLPEDGSDPVEPSELGPELLGYLSAVLYLGARIPQITQNYKKKSVYGLSLLFFLFSILGNVSYSCGIIFFRSDSEYLKLYMPWLLGSLGTVFEDLIIIVQFWVYGPYIEADLESAIAD